MYIYIYCIYISHKKIQRLPPPRRASPVPSAGTVRTTAFWAGFGEGFGTRILLILLLLLFSAVAPGSQTSSAGRLLGCVPLGEPTPPLSSLPLSFLDFFFFCFFPF